MRVVHFHFGKDGGAERFFTNLVIALHECGVEQRMFIRPDRVWRKDIDHCGTIYEGTFNRLSISRFFLAARVRRVIREFQPNALLAWAPRANRMMPAWRGCIRIGRLGDFPLRLDYFRNTDVLVGNVPGIAQRLRDLGWTKPVEVISNFTLAQPVAAIDRAKLNTPADAFLIVGAGRFVPRKGFHTLIEAIARVEGAWLWLVGDGEERSNLEALSQKLGVSDRVRFAGWQSDPSPFVAAADAFAMPSTHEPLGNVILEAWAIGTAVVAARSEGPSWMMTDLVDGMLVGKEDVAGLASSLQRLREDANLRQALVAGGRKTVALRFSKDAITEAYLKLFSQSPPARS